MKKNTKIKDEQKGKRWSGLKKLALNKWSLTFAVMLMLLSAYVGLEEQERAAVGDGVLYVTDTLPYEVQKVSGEGQVQILKNDNENEDKNDEADKPDDQMSDDAEGTAAKLDNTPEQGKQPQDDGQNLQTGSGLSINSDSDFFINYRLEREKARSRQLEMLQGLIDDEKSSAEIRQQSQQKIIEQAEAIEQELMLESILVAKYGGEAAVFIQPEKVNVVLNISPDNMSDSEAEKIAAVVDNYTGIGYENVIVVMKD